MTIKVPDFSKANILVIGDLMLDRYWHGDTSRISPESPVPVVNVNQVENRAGGAANVALNLAALGAQVSVAGITGEDSEAELLESLLQAAGVSCLFEKRANQATITKLRVISRNQQLIRLDFEKDFALQNPIKHTQLEQQLEQYDLIVLSDYNKGTLQAPQSIIAKAKQSNIPLLVDPKGNDFRKYRGATLLTPNQSEFEAIVGKTHDDEILLSQGEALRKELELGALLITRSEKGMALIEQSKQPYLQPTQAKEISDVTGAGDTVIATLAAAYAVEQNLVLASKVANIAAGIVISKLGTATVSPSELQAAIEQDFAPQHGVVTEQQLLNLIATAKAKNEILVMTNGCFDILHPGHAAYLKEAAALGDRLIVAVNDDDSVQRLKGDARPINPLSHRMQMLSSLTGVDWVVAFSEDTPERIIGRCLPDILVKGGDYKAEDIAGYEAVKANGGEVKILQFKAGYSTSSIIEKIRR
ncbi:bifunctional D-glycero-beta-D-manno-heptose-7-phosphate kinase/D-glycero-beta-D-manno-heptose 1-phosphate adenylyltransferase HldE [Kangiella sp. TOML190]|uniref:bifunctional D-glycero-beta-D-manno-heptose-7-phosphate kinase/D-glycero-beta-D-manno-heptose 1-phosphate adenylyltransferase HldE n=1 Tax=Kangiella sp. TOML190 TaxID=2931351 RepID=UPI00203EFC3E|nr:bifunctional D-glycero-beta-D-manno-heptose-7-phosphate kinase/D-glycero-beta-D-manno-heptose 1-phosphate adenylyltransferase HldE [Kangiella sp. TOML190]